MTIPDQSVGSELLDRILPAWRQAVVPGISRAYFDSFVARNRAELVRRFDELAAKQAPRPRAGRDAVRALVRRLHLMPQGVRVASMQYHTPDVMPRGDELDITFRGEASAGSGTPTMVLHAGPRQGDDIDLRGELRDGDGAIVASFGWIVVNRRELVILKETSLAAWFGVETTPERKLAPSMLRALAMLRAEEGGDEEMHYWDGVHESTKDALIARGLAVVLPNKRGGASHFKTTTAGRARLIETSTYIAPPAPKGPDPEEARMGDALRAESVREEAEWEAAMERGVAFEASQGADPKVAKRTTVNNLANDIHFYDGKPAAFKRTTIYPLKFSHEGLAELFAKLNETPMETTLWVVGQSFDRTNMAIDESGLVVVTYRPASTPNPQPIKLPNGARAQAFVPGDMIISLTNKAAKVAFSVELRNHEGREIASSDWWQGELASVIRISGQKIEQLCGLATRGTQNA